MEGTVTRTYDVSHLTRTCDACDEFDRHANQRVIDQYDAFEADPPEALDWGSLDRKRKLLVSERVARHGQSAEDLAPDTDGEAESEADTAEASAPAEDDHTDDAEAPSQPIEADHDDVAAAEEESTDDPPGDEDVDPDATNGGVRTDVDPDGADSAPGGG